MMQVELVNDGPVTILIDSRNSSDAIDFASDALHCCSSLSCCCFQPRRWRSNGRWSPKIPRPSAPAACCSRPGSTTAADVEYPASGLDGQPAARAALGVSVGISSIAEMQIDGGFHNHLTITGRHPGAARRMVTATGDTTGDVEDIVDRHEGADRCRKACGGRRSAFRFATRLPNANNESGLGLDTTDFTPRSWSARPSQSVRMVGNVGLGILGDPVDGNRQNDVVTYGAVARPRADASAPKSSARSTAGSTRATASRRPAPTRAASSAWVRATPWAAGAATRARPRSA